MAELVTAEDLATYLRQDVERNAAEQAINLAEAEVVTVYGSDVLPDVGSRPRELLRKATFSAAVRIYRNPEGYATERVGDYAYSRDGAGTSLSQDEIATIRAARAPLGTARSGFATATLAAPADWL